jgi:ribosomal-protein-alanine N-acetyltransferase
MGDKKEWGKGYAKEASKTIVDYCFGPAGIRKITLGVVEDNVNAVKLYEKLGFAVEGRYRKHGFYAGKFCNVLRMALFNPEFES